MGETTGRDNLHATTIKGPKAPVPKLVDREGPIHQQMFVDLWSPRPDPDAAAESAAPLRPAVAAPRAGGRPGKRAASQGRRRS
jgi:hypothetical protein